jgi:4'-phosphopantetheinyl transferase EntD
MLRGLVSMGVGTGVCAIGELGALPTPPAPDRPPAPATEKRHSDFTLGRIAAKRALAEIGAPTCPISNVPGRGPSWPRGVVGSISHSGGNGVAVADSADNLTGIGVDIEVWQGGMPWQAQHTVLTPEERRWTGLQRGERWATAIFCCKEATYKAIPESGAMELGFQDISFYPAGAGVVAGVLRHRGLSGTVRARYAWSEHLVLACVELERDEIRPANHVVR